MKLLYTFCGQSIKILYLKMRKLYVSLPSKESIYNILWEFRFRESFEWVQNKCGWCVDFELNLWWTESANGVNNGRVSSLDMRAGGEQKEYVRIRKIKENA